MVAIHDFQGVAQTRLESKPASVRVARATEARSSAGDGGKVLPRPTDAPGRSPTERAELERLMTDINARVQHVQRRLHFSIDEASGKTIVKVIDRESDKVIRQIPTEEMLALARRLESDNSALIAVSV
jgi:flagellar protein FlaG